MLRLAIVHDGGAYQSRLRDYLGSQQRARLDEFQMPANLPFMIDEADAADIVPAAVSEAEVVIAVGLHMHLLAELPHVMGGGRGKALLVPQEDPTWVRPGMIRQVTRDCARYEIESAFPKPFCNLEPRTPVLTRFCSEYRAGKHRIHLTCRNGEITEAICRRSSPCGLTDWLAAQLQGRPCDESLPEQFAELLHLRPCLASMAMDDELQDTIMHRAIDLVETAAAEELERLGVAVA